MSSSKIRSIREQIQAGDYPPRHAMRVVEQKLLEVLRERLPRCEVCGTVTEDGICPLCYERDQT